MDNAFDGYTCNDCPRNCGVERGKVRGFCGCGNFAAVAKVVSPFDYEEPCLGELSAIFFGGCSLRCSYCQNIKISRGQTGTEYSDARLARMFDETDYTLDLVTPTHYLRAVESAMRLCTRPHRIIYNTSGYETERAVERAARFTDVFLTDFKYCDGSISGRLSSAPDYFDRAAKATLLMRKLVPDEWDGKTLTRGLVVRHLVLPGCSDDSMRVLEFIAERLGTNTVISLMSQFTPNGAGEPSERLKKIEYKLVVKHARRLGFRNGFIQDFSSATSEYTPEF